MKPVERAISYGVGAVMLNTLIVVILTFLRFLGKPLIICIAIAVVALILNIVFNAKKFEYLKQTAEVSALRVIFLDAFMASLSFVYTIYIIEENVLDLFVVFAALFYLPLLHTNKKIS